MSGPAAVAVEPTALLGDWRLCRRLRDQRAGRFGIVEGSLTLRAEGGLIAWHEEGTLRWNGSRTPISRDYQLRHTDEGWWMEFADGRAFHPWRPGHWVSHPCAADVYDGLVSITGPDSWRTLWDVRGPDKSQRIITRLTRTGSG